MDKDIFRILMSDFWNNTILMNKNNKKQLRKLPMFVQLERNKDQKAVVLASNK